ncbi:hypothetical protein [Micromonospora carbonacea]|uniref:hypothetical protein n=1 Tax=Micromonospora carbonacea TaxID=47853 RepID=UPI003717BCBF
MVVGLGHGDVPFSSVLAESEVLVISDAVSIVFGGVVPGFLLGLLTFRVKSRWCPRCGESTLAVPPVEQDR